VVSVREAARTIRPSWPRAMPRLTLPAPNWIDVDRESLKGRVQSLPKREDLVQIQLNEQLIVELYSK